MKLVIVESPAKCSKIESFLGKGYKCIASFGHIRQIANGLKSIDVKNDYNVELDVFSESDSEKYDPKNKAKTARPFKPAILIE